MHPYPPHLAGFDYVGLNRYFLTFCTHERRPLFTRPEHVALVEDHFLRSGTECGFADLAHCFMPEHLHAAVAARRDDCDLKRFVARMKQFSGFYFSKQFGARLWQRYGYEHVIRSDEVTVTVIRYVLENPIRARLVSRVRDDPFIGSGEYSREQLLEICTDL
jgi:REP element-mobilizing transposase RayT